MQTVKIVIHTSERSIEAEAATGSRLDDALLAAGILIDRPCGGRGKCSKCLVRVKGMASAPTEIEKKRFAPVEIEQGRRLSCQARVEGDLEVWFDSPPAFTDKTFGSAAEAAKVEGPLGLAIDLGTTTVAAFLVSLADGRVFAGNAAANKQGAHGADVMSRLTAAENDPYNLRKLAWDSIRTAAAGLLLEQPDRERVKIASVVGNTAMHHLLIGLPIKSLVRSPFKPTTTDAGEAPALELKKGFPNLSRILLAPLIGGFVGSDALACLVYFGANGNGGSLVIDLGTNGEVMLSAGGKTFATSAAAGPAFEAVNISCGQRAIPGAIAKVTWSDETGFSFHTIGDKPPRGFCGSGLISAVNLLRRLGVVEASGRIAEGSSLEGLAIVPSEHGRKVVFAKDAFLTQNDIREVQKAKAAIRAAVDMLMERAGTTVESVRRVILTGAFGAKVDTADVLELGIIPPFERGVVFSIPNGAGMGAAMMLKDENFLAARQLARSIEHVELNLDPAFMDRFVASMSLGGGGI